MSKDLSRSDVYQLGKELDAIRHRIMTDIDDLTAIYSAFDATVDIRITAMSRLLVIFDSAYLALTFIRESLMCLEWWQRIASQASQKEIKLTVKNFSDFSKIAFVHQMFSCMESAFRVLLRAIDPVACNNGRSEFKSIYDCLFKSKLFSYPPESIEFLDLFRLVRNTVHNNGVYFHPAKAIETVVWRGKQYRFQHELPVNFMNWDFCLKLSDEVRRLLKTAACDPNLQAIDNLIVDPFAVNTKPNIQDIE